MKILMFNHKTEAFYLYGKSITLMHSAIAWTYSLYSHTKREETKIEVKVVRIIYTLEYM